jgi:predicted RNA methylase
MNEYKKTTLSWYEGKGSVFMNSNIYEIRDNCRKNLNKYTLRAFSLIPKIENPLILDMGCGTGVPTLALMEACNCSMYAVDVDNLSLLWLFRKCS